MKSQTLSIVHNKPRPLTVSLIEIGHAPFILPFTRPRTVSLIVVREPSSLLASVPIVREVAALQWSMIMINNDDDNNDNANDQWQQ